MSKAKRDHEPQSGHPQDTASAGVKTSTTEAEPSVANPNVIGPAAGRLRDHGRFVKGSAGGPGSKPGRITRQLLTLREGLDRALHTRRDKSGKRYGSLHRWLDSLPDDLFVRLADRLLPRQLDVAVEDRRPAKLTVVFLTPEQSAQRALGEVPVDAEPLRELPAPGVDLMRAVAEAGARDADAETVDQAARTVGEDDDADDDAATDG